MQRSDLRPGFSSGKAGAKDAQLVSPRCGNPFSLRQRKTQSTTLGEYEKRHEFALSKTCLPSISAEMRIAASLRSSQ